MLIAITISLIVLGLIIKEVDQAAKQAYTEAIKKENDIYE